MKPVVLRWLYQEMLKIRFVGDALTGSTPGEEIVCAGSCFALTPRDQVFSTLASAAPYVARGGDLKTMADRIHDSGKSGAKNLSDPRAGFRGAGSPGADTISLAVEAASAAVATTGEKPVILCFLTADEAAGLGRHDALSRATREKLPIVFVCENPDPSLPAPPWERAGVNDVERVAETATRAIDRARAGGGPAFLEFGTGDLDDCPIRQLGDRLLRAGHATEQQFRAMRDTIQEEIAQALRLAAESRPSTESAALPRQCA